MEINIKLDKWLLAKFQSFTEWMGNASGYDAVDLSRVLLVIFAVGNLLHYIPTRDYISIFAIIGVVAIDQWLCWLWKKQKGKKTLEPYLTILGFIRPASFILLLLPVLGVLLKPDSWNMVKLILDVMETSVLYLVSTRWYPPVVRRRGVVYG